MNKKTGTPIKITLTIGALVAIVASLTPIGKLEEMVNIGTLTAFALVSLAVPILRKRRPDLERSFKVPFSPCLPILAAVVCLYLALNLSIETWLRFLVWMVLGFAIYFLYGYGHSRVGRGEGVPAEDYSRARPDRATEPAAEGAGIPRTGAGRTRVVITSTVRHPPAARRSPRDRGTVRAHRRRRPRAGRTQRRSGAGDGARRLPRRRQRRRRSRSRT